ncbi:hypothetical protein C1706_11675 [Propioniciclava flava]|uniref:Uncharacterized protein n=1 Tax=Propioniciclava flava TaxID=2072026 RepID=A0A4Q2EG02_9ACTN|nr:hypothetical protein C1706_11675 [Propioniciclava flava]
MCAYYWSTSLNSNLIPIFFAPSAIWFLNRPFALIRSNVFIDPRSVQAAVLSQALVRWQQRTGVQVNAKWVLGVPFCVYEVEVAYR